MENKYISIHVSPALNVVHHSFLLKNITNPSIFLKSKKDIPKVWHRVKFLEIIQAGLEEGGRKIPFLWFKISYIVN